MGYGFAVAGGSCRPRRGAHLRRSSRAVLHQRHKAKIHVKLLMAVEKRRARRVRDQVNFHRAARGNNHHILEHARCRLSRVAGDFKGMPVQVDGMGHVATIVEDQAVARSRHNEKRIRLRIRLTVDRPKIAVRAARTPAGYSQPVRAPPPCRRKLYSPIQKEPASPTWERP